MIILNIINHENNKIEYHFSHDDFKGIVFKILSQFDIVKNGDEHYLTCDYDELEHNFNDIEIESDRIKQVCDEFSMATLQSLYVAIKKDIQVEAENNNKNASE